jgi:hypothetical protein
MFEPQDHPNDFQYPGGPPVPPYDAAGWTLAYQMGVGFDRVQDAVSGPFKSLPAGELIPLEGRKDPKTGKAGYVLSAANNHAYAAANGLLAENIPVFLTTESVGEMPKGSFFIPQSAKAKSWITQHAAAMGADVMSLDKKPSAIKPLQAARIALWDTYGGSMPSGWMRWIMEQFNFKANIIYAQEIDKGDLISKYDVILFVGGAMPPVNGPARNFGSPKPEDIPEEFRKTIGNITVAQSIPELKKFMEAGGKILTIGSSTSLAYHLNLPVSNALVETVNGKERELPNEKFYIPGSVMQVTLDNNHPAAWGMGNKADVLFDDSPVFHINPAAQSAGNIKPIAWFATGNTLRSGWAWGQAYLKDGVAAFSAQVGKGSLLAFGPEITFRAQSHGTFKLVFNQLYK